MKILTIVHNLEKGRVQRTAQNFTTAYKKLGHDFCVLAMYGLGTRYHEIKDILYVWEGISPSTYKQIYDFSSDAVRIHSSGPKEEDFRPLLNRLKSQGSIIIEKNVFSTPSQWSGLVDISFQFSLWCQWLFNIRGGEGLKSAIVPNLINES